MNPRLNLGDFLRTRAAQYPGVTALYCREQTSSYAELDASTDALAIWFVRRGLKPGDRLAIQWPNSIETVQLYFAAFKAGLIAVPVNLRLKPSELEWVIGNSGAKLCFAHPALAEPMQQTGVEVLSELPALPTVSRPEDFPVFSDDAPALILYTSGSTGRPKGAVHTHQSLVETARICTQEFLESYPADAGSGALVMTPLMHASGLYVLLSVIWAGQSCILLPVFEPAEVLDAIQKYRCALTLTLPALMQFVLEEQVRKPRDVSSLKVIFAGGDSVAVALQARVREILGAEILEGLAQSETGPSISSPLAAPRPGSIGVLLKGVEIRLVDSEGRDVADGEPGELLVRSGAVCTGYWNNPAATAESVSDGWFRTGDLVSRDADGYYWFRGRLKEIIIRGGSNISPQEVEEVLYKHPEILEAGVVGMAHPVWGEQVIAFVALRDGGTAAEEEIRTHAREHLADYKVPERIHFLPVLPKGATGKVHRKALKDHLFETFS